MDNNQFNNFNQNNPQSGTISTKKLLEYIGAGCSFLGAVLTFIFSIVTCSRGGTASADRATTKHILSMSYAWIGVMIGIIICIAGIVLLIISKEKEAGLSKLALIAMIVAVVAAVYAILVHVTICSYNCSINSYYYDKMKSFSSYFDYYN